MRNLILVLAVLFGSAAGARQVETTAELENYRQYLKTVTGPGLYFCYADNIARVGGTCSLSLALTGAAFFSDTVPLINPVAEWIGNKANKNYSTYDTILSWETLANTGRGALGGGVIAGYEVFDFLVKYAAGEKMEWEQLKKVYASSFAVKDAVFSDDSRCLVSLEKLAMVRVEWRIRSGVKPFTPMMAPR